MPCCLSAALSIYYCVLASRTRPDDARDHFAAPCSYQRLAPPGSLLFSICGHIRPKSALLCSYYIRTVRSECSCLLPFEFESTSFLFIYHNSITNPSCYDTRGCVYLTVRHCTVKRLWVVPEPLLGIISVLQIIYLVCTCVYC